MAERVHPSDSPVRTEGSSHSSGRIDSGDFPKKPNPPPGTYVVQIPKDQIYRIPPPENTHRFQYLSRRKVKRSRCRCCICSFLAALLILVVLAGISAGVLYLVFKPEALKYSVDGISIRGINLTSKSMISPRFDVIVRSRNPNGKIGIDYEDGNAIDVSYNGVNLCHGAWPAIYQPPKNVTLLKTALTGTTIHLTKADRKTMLNQEKNRKVPFKLKIEAPVKIKIGSVKTWTITVKVNCDLTVNKLTTQSKVVERKCSHAVDLW